MVVVLSGALGIHPDTQPGPSAGEEQPPELGAPWDAIPPRPSAAAVTQRVVVLLADLLSMRGRPLRGYLEGAFTDPSRAAVGGEDRRASRVASSSRPARP